MDVWVFAAAAGAACLVKYWQNVLKGQESSSESIQYDSFEEIPGPDVSAGSQSIDRKPPQISGGSIYSCSLGKRMERLIKEDALTNSDDVSSSVAEIRADLMHLDVPGSSACEVASTSGTNNLPRFNFSRDEENNVFTFSSLQPTPFREGNDQDGDIFHGKSCYGINDRTSISMHHGHRLYSRRTDTGYRFCKDGGSPNHKISLCYPAKPRNSLESCFISQLYCENIEVAEHAFSSLSSSPMPTMFPYEQIEGRQHTLHPENGDLRQNETCDYILPLSHMGLIEFPWKPKKSTTCISNTRCSRKNLQSQGVSEKMVFFYLGMSIGVMSKIMSNKKEIDDLNESLKQTQNLVQDLQDELEMKESVTMKELENEDYMYQQNCPGMEEQIGTLLCRDSTGFSPDRVAIESPQLDGKDAFSGGEKKKLELSKIEAELEAELERLELNMNDSRVGRIPELSEIDPDLLAEVVQGELRHDMINGCATDSDSDTRGSSSDHIYPSNYAVSPKELSLRLHELIQSRLEDRITELESALGDSLKRLRRIEAQRDFSNSDIGTPYTVGTPTTMEPADSTVYPLHINLTSRDAEINTPNKMSGFELIHEDHLFNQTPRRDLMRSGNNGSAQNFESCRIMLQNSMNAEAADEFEDEMGKLLIKQIVEKTRQGSPVVLNAQRILFSMDE